MIRKKIEKRLPSLIATLMSVMLLIGVVPLLVEAADPTLVQINPASQTVTAGQTFTINVSCTPGQPIKGFEFGIVFNPTYLTANSVSQGNIFNGYNSSFNSGIINNTGGSIDDIYAYIVGAGNVSTAGRLVTLSFTAKSISGMSTIGLTGVGVTNETTYVPITITNGTVTLREYSLTITNDGSGSITKNPNAATYPYGTEVQLTAIADTGWTFSSWGGNLSGSTNPTSIIMNSDKSVTAYFTQNQYTLTINTVGSGSVTKNPDQATYTYGQVVGLTANPQSGWAFNQWTGDLTGSQNPANITINGNKIVTAQFVDIKAPEISGITRATSNPLDTNPTYGWVNVSCTVTDNVAVSQVMIQIQNPDDSWNNVSMTTTSPGTYYYNSTTAFSTAGNYSYTIQATDTSTNQNTSSTVVFAMPPNWDINNDGKCDIMDLVLVSNHYHNTGANGWISEDIDNNGIVQVLDLVLVSNHYSQSWWV